MLEVYLQESSPGTWDLKATLLPHGGLSALAQDALVVSVSAPNFGAAYAALDALPFEELTFTPNPDRWPAPNPKFQIVNEGTHSEREEFGNYKITLGEHLVARIEQFPRNSRTELIREALKVVAELEYF